MRKQERLQYQRGFRNINAGGKTLLLNEGCKLKYIVV